jgi:glycosyltransferase involved in cell wall biosynthesis
MLSILIPTYNYFIENLVTTLHKQCISVDIEFEIIVLEDFSSEDYIFLNKNIALLSNCSYKINSVNFGRTKTRQILAEKAKFDWVLFLDADVIPVHDNFIEKYVSNLRDTTAVVFGGYQYDEKQPEISKILRYRYGKEREEKSDTIRSKNPYQFVFSGNMLIQKKLFLELNFKDDRKFYGMDIFFAYQLYSQQIVVKHIDNAIFHHGLENNEVFFEKSLQSVVSRKYFLDNKAGVDSLNPLLKAYLRLKKYYLTKPISLVFYIIEPLLKKNILSNNPNLKYFDWYRLGYICSLNSKQKT